VATDAAGNVYVVDMINQDVQKFAGTGTFLVRWGLPGSSNGEFHSPFGVATDAAGNVYITDQANDRIQKFDGTGTYLAQWGGSGSGNGQFYLPRGIAVDFAANVYVADDNNRIQKFTNTGTYLTQWGSVGISDGQFNYPSGVATDAAGDVYVTDLGNGRIEKFTSTGTYLTQWGSPGGGDGQFLNPYGAATDAAGAVYVVDQGNQRIQKFGAQAPELEADLDLAPNVINLKSHAPWLTAYIEPSGFDPSSIDLSTLRLAGSVPAVSKFAIVGDHNRNGAPDLIVKFSREALDPLLAPGAVELEVTGSLVTGENFTGSDEVRVIDPPAAHLSASVTPNPLNPAGVLSFETSRPGPVKVSIFDVRGRKVRVLMDVPTLPAGSHVVPIDGRGARGQTLASGLYFFRVEAAEEAVTGRIVIMK
jgi:streptogramin lyase